MKAELVPENGDAPIPILKDLTVIGRREFCDVFVDHPSLSKRHCVVVKTDGLLIVRDLASTNGTKVKGQRIRWAALLPEDRLSFGLYKVRVYLGPDHLPSPSELRSRADGVKDIDRTPIASERPKASAAPSPISQPSAWSQGDDLSRFASPSPLEIPIVSSAVSDKAEEDNEAGWRGLLGKKDDEIRIDLD
ncbi:FHA domain-containing protein [Isosphaeraceae bacterium EP7]